MDVARNSSKSVSPSEYCNVYGSRVEQAVDAFMDRLGGRLGELEVELRYAWRAVDLLSQEYVKMWEKLERLEILLYEQQNVIAQLLSVIKSTGEDPEEYLNTRGDSVASDASLKDRLLMKHPDLESSDLSESDLMGVSGFGAQAEDGSESDQSSLKWGKKYPGFACSSKYIDPSVTSDTPDWEAASQGSPSYFHPDLLQYPRREIFTASDYKRYRGGSPCISERDLEELDRLSADLHKVSSSTTSTAAARDVYKTLSHIRNSPLRRCMLGAESEGGFDPDMIARIAKLPPYDDLDKSSATGSDRLDLRTSTESLRYTPDSSIISAKEKEDLRDSEYLNRATTSSWGDSSARGVGMMYSTYTSEVQSAPIPPTRGAESSDYGSTNYLGHTIEERQKGHALTPVTEISPEYAASDTPGNGAGPSPTSTDKLGSVTDVTVSPLSPLEKSKTIKAEVHSGDGKSRQLDSSLGGDVINEAQAKQQTSDSISPNVSPYSTSPSYKDKHRRGKELPTIPYQKSKKSELLSVDSSYKKGNSNTFPPPKNTTTKTKKGKESSPVPGRRKLPQPYIDKSGNITYDKSQAVAPAPVPFTQSLSEQYEAQNKSSDVSQSKTHFDSGQLPVDQKHSSISYEAEGHDKLSYNRINSAVIDTSQEQKDDMRYSPKILPTDKAVYEYDKESNVQSYDHPPAPQTDVHETKTYQDPTCVDSTMQYASQYYPETDNYNNETYSTYEQPETDYNDQTAVKEGVEYQWDAQSSENWAKGNEVVDQYQYTDGSVAANDPSNAYVDYDRPQQDMYDNTGYEVPPDTYQEPQYYESQNDQTYQGYETDTTNVHNAQYTETQSYVQEDYNYYPQEGSTEYSSYSYDQQPQSADQPPVTQVYNAEDLYPPSTMPMQPEEYPSIPPEKPPREHEKKTQITPKVEKFTASPQHKGYSPQKCKSDRSQRRQRQYSDPVTSASAILSQTQVVTSDTITPSTKQLSSSATSVADDSAASGGGIFSVLSNKVSKGYKSMISMPGLSKTEATKPPPAAPPSAAASNKSGSMTSLFNIGSTLDGFKLSRNKSRSDSVKSESELSLYDEPQAVIDYQEPATDRSGESSHLLTKDAEDEAEVFYGEAEPEYNDEQQLEPPLYPNESVDYPEDEYQDTLEYPDEPVPDDYYTQDTDAYQEEAPPLSVENGRTVTFAEESVEPKESFSARQDRKKSLAADDAFASLFQTVSRVRHPPGQPKHVTEDSTESGVLTASMSNESAFFSCAGDSRQSSIAQSEYGSLGSTESVVPYDRDVKPETGSLESYGEKATIDDARSSEDRGSAEDATSLAEGSIISETAGHEEAGGESAPKKGKKVQFENRSPSTDNLDEQSEKVKKAVSSTKSKWMKLAVRTHLSIFNFLFAFVCY